MRITLDLNFSTEDFSVEANQQRLFQGLDAWQQLGLLSDEQVRQLCDRYLSVPLPLVSEIVSEGEKGQDGRLPLPAIATATDFVVAPPASQHSVKAAVSRSPALIPRLLQSFVAEISVIWLLFLGVFLVVVSSGVLAATQWRNFPPVGQYAILFTYTLAFWGASVWIGRQAKLRLTARMLSIATLLLIPVNFWMMDGLGVGQTAVGWVIAAIASVVLTIITIRLLNPTVTLTGSSLQNSLSLVTVNAIALNGLHWGWGWSGVPLIATYIGTIGTAVCLLRSPPLEPSETETSKTEPSESTKPSPPAIASASQLPKGVIAFAVLLLIGRAIFVAQVPAYQLGLAFGVCGWLLIRLSRPLSSRGAWGWLGAALLMLGWLVSVSQEPPWQAIAVSGLGLWLLWRLQRHWQRWQLTAFLWVGLQAFWLLWFLLPETWREGVITTIGAIAGSVTGWEFASVGGMIYVGIMVVLAGRLRRWQQIPLAQQTEGMALGLGCLMVALAWTVPLLQSLTLSMAVLALVKVLRDRPGERFGIYFTHAIGLAALLSWIATLFPGLNETAGAGVLLALMVLEWGLSLSSIAVLWRKSAWYAGLVLAVLAYLVLGLTDPLTSWNLIGLATPIMLTIVALHPTALQPRIAAGLTILALVLQLLILDPLPPQIITLGIGTLLLFLNSRRWRSLLFAIFTVGFGLGFVSTWVYQAFAIYLTPLVIVMLMAIALWGLWGLRGWLRRRTTPLRTVYAIALDGWAIGLCSLILLILTAYTTSFYGGFGSVTIQFVWAAGLTTAALGYRQWQQSTELGLWGLAWAVELGVAGIIILVNPARTAIPLAIATLALGFASQLLGDWRRITSSSYRSWHAIPLTYAGLGFVLSHSTYTEFTGLYTLAAALIAVGVGRRQPFLQPITYLGLAGISIALYELLIYQLLQAEGGNFGDGITLLAGLAAGIAVGDRLLSRWLLPYLRLSSADLNPVAHLHWAIGSGLALLAPIASLSFKGVLLWMGITAVLSAYALAAGNRHLNSTEAINRSRDGISANRASSRLDPSSLIPQPASSGTAPASSATPPASSATPPASLIPQPASSVAPPASSGNAPASSAVPPASLAIPSSFFSLPSSPSSLAVWTYAGIIEAIILVTYALYRLLPPSVLSTWGAAIAAVVCLLLYPLPWERWGWSAQPWRRSTAFFPGLVTAMTLWAIALQALLIVGAFYAWLAKSARQVRLSYISILVLDWAMLRFLGEQGWLEPLWLSAVIGGSVLYMVQIDPELQGNEREKRHLLRMLATGLICLTALYQAEVELQPAAIVYALLTLGLSIGLILLGLVLRVRAFLYVGTATFVLRVLRLLWLFISTYSVLLWAVGIVLGLVFIWIAATFEVRRTQVNTLMQQWTSELAIWE